MASPAILLPDPYEQLLNLPEGVNGELIAGEVHASPRPRPAHALVETGLGYELTGPFGRGKGGPGGWWIVGEPELHLGRPFARDLILIPDLAGWRKARMPLLPDAAAFTLVPDWVCEILSPSTARLDRVVKMPAYASVGVKHLWMVDVDARTLETYGLEDGRWVNLGNYSDDDAVEAPPFDAVALPLGQLWPPRPEELEPEAGEE